MGMKISKYTKIIQDNSTILYNTFNSGIIELENNRVSLDGHLNMPLFSEEEIEYLQDNLYLDSCDKHITEELRNSYTNVKSSGLAITVEITSQCNLICSYCYQNDWEKKRVINQETILDIRAYIASTLKSKEYSGIKLSLIGGEPLLHPEQVFQVLDIFTSLCKEKAIPLITTINTNGTVLSDSTFEKLNTYDNLTLYIALSGKEDHNSHRCFKSSQGTYELIINNIKKILEMPQKNLKLLLRYNVNHFNLNSFEEYITKLKSLGINRVDVKYIYNHIINIFTNKLTYKEFQEWYTNTAIPLLLENDFDILTTIPCIKSPCKAYRNENFKFFADGKLGLCDASVYSQLTPNVRDLLNIDIFNAYNKDHKQFNPMEDPECSQCEDIIICGGKYFCREQCLTYTEVVVEDFLKQYLKSNKKENFVYFANK